MGLPLHDVYILAAVEDRRDENAAPQLGGTMQSSALGHSATCKTIRPMSPFAPTADIDAPDRPLERIIDPADIRGRKASCRTGGGRRCTMAG
jgi:hypothetical protein